MVVPVMVTVLFQYVGINNRDRPTAWLPALYWIIISYVGLYVRMRLAKVSISQLGLLRTHKGSFGKLQKQIPCARYRW